MFPAKDLDLPPPRTHPLDETVHFIRLATSLAHFRDNDVRIKASVGPRRELEVPVFVDIGLDTHKHVLLGVIQPVACATRANNALQLMSMSDSV